MSVRIVRGEEAAPLSPLREMTVAVLGYGNQGRAHALNLRDSGIVVVVANRLTSGGADRARADGFEPVMIEQATAAADLVIVALPDEVQAELYRRCIAPHLRGGSVLGFLHGFAIRFRLVEPPQRVGVVMVAPKGPGSLLRQRFEQGQGLPCLVAVQQAPAGVDAEAIALAWANGIGSARAGIVYTSFAEETETDLFGEQSVLCGGLTELILVAFETLVEAGYPPELAYLECCHEVKQIADLVYHRGLRRMMSAISNTAEFGAYDAGPRIVDARVRDAMRAVLEDIRNGRFADRMQEDHAGGFRWFHAERERLARHPIEGAGETIRALMRGTGSDRSDGAAPPSTPTDAGYPRS